MLYTQHEPNKIPPEISSQILQLQSEGFKRREIAEKLSIPEHKVDKVIASAGVTLTKEQRRQNVASGKAAQSAERWRPGLTEDIRALRQAGKTIEQIAEELQTTLGKVISDLRGHNLTPEQVSAVHCFYSRETIDKAIEMRRQGRKLADIIQETGMSQGALYFWFAKEGVRLAPEQRGQAVRSLSDEQLSDLYQRRRKGEKIADLAIAFQVSGQTVKNWLSRSGVKPDPTPKELIEETLEKINTLSDEQTSQVTQEIITESSVSPKAKGHTHSLVLSTEEFEGLVNSPCHYCGVGGPNGVDRKDNSIGYTVENSLSACIHCNYAKGNLTYQTYFEWIDRLVAFRLASR